MSDFNARKKIVIIAFCLMLLLSGCATHDGLERNFDGSIEPYGFFSGLWHGFIFPVALALDIGLFALSLFIYFGVCVYDGLHGLPIGSFFDLSELVHLLGAPNTGLFYYIGFLIGLSNCIGSGGAASQQRQ